LLCLVFQWSFPSLPFYLHVGAAGIETSFNLYTVYEFDGDRRSTHRTDTVDEYEEIREVEESKFVDAMFLPHFYPLI